MNPPPPGLWTRGLGDEYLAGCTTPLGAGLLVPWIADEFLRELARMCGARELLTSSPLRRIHAHVYLSGDFLAVLLRALPRGQRAVASLGWLPAAELRRVEAQRWRPLLALRLLGARRRDPRSSLRGNPAALDRHRLRLEAVVAPLLEQDYGSLSTAEWRRQLDEAGELGREHFRVIRWGVGLYAPALHGLLAGWLRRRWGGRGAELHRAIVAGLPETWTSRIDREVWRLAAAARGEPPLRELLRGGATAEDARAALPGVAFWPAFDALLRDHGHRAPGRDISLPRWRETPDVVLGLVRAHLAGAGSADPAAAVAAAVRRREGAESEVLAVAGRGPLGPVRRAILRRLVRHAVVYTCYREDQRYHLDRLLLHLRLLALEMGRRLAAAGVLADPGDVFLLEPHELRRLADRPFPDPGLQAALDARREEVARWRDELPPALLGSDGDADDDAALTGTGVSGGRARGPARVVHDLDGLAEVRPGEVLVATTIDPAWTSVFPMLAGLVTETGGALSHGAIIAREYGIPAVAGVGGATLRVRTAELLEIDGDVGSLRLLDDGAGVGNRPGTPLC